MDTDSKMLEKKVSKLNDTSKEVLIENLKSDTNNIFKIRNFIRTIRQNLKKNYKVDKIGQYNDNEILEMWKYKNKLKNIN